jgi:hypothetical protein
VGNQLRWLQVSVKLPSLDKAYPFSTYCSVGSYTISTKCGQIAEISSKAGQLYTQRRKEVRDTWQISQLASLQLIKCLHPLSACVIIEWQA